MNINSLTFWENKINPQKYRTKSLNRIMLTHVLFEDVYTTVLNSFFMKHLRHFPSFFSYQWIIQVLLNTYSINLFKYDIRTEKQLTTKSYFILQSTWSYSTFHQNMTFLKFRWVLLYEKFIIIRFFFEITNYVNKYKDLIPWCVT